MVEPDKISRIKKQKELEFQHYLDIITKVMEPDGSFLELGPGSISLSDYLADVTILDKDTEVVKMYAGKKRKVLQGDYHNPIFLPNSFDYVIAIHPELCNSGRNIVWINPKEFCFKFKNSGLEEFVSSLIDVARKKVFIVSKSIADSLPIKEFASQVVTEPYSFVLYEKSTDGRVIKSMS